MDRQAHRQWHTPLPRQARIELPHGLYNPESGPHRPLRIILVGQGVAKIDQQSIAEILRDMALKTLDHCRAGRLISAHRLAQLFRDLQKNKIPYIVEPLTGTSSQVLSTAERFL